MPTLPPGAENLIRDSVIGVMFVLVMLGYLRPKWDSDAAAKREAAKDAIIESLTDSLRRLADKLEAKR